MAIYNAGKYSIYKIKGLSTNANNKRFYLNLIAHNLFYICDSNSNLYNFTYSAEILMITYYYQIDKTQSKLIQLLNGSTLIKNAKKESSVVFNNTSNEVIKLCFYSQTIIRFQQ